MSFIYYYNGGYQLPNEILEAGPEDRFNYIFESGIWEKSTAGESKSGSGSTLANTQIYRSHLTQFLRQNPRVTLFDAPCGDLNWIIDIIESEEFTYIGGDISSELIKWNKERHPSLSLMRFDITKDLFPVADIWHCRHCLMHLSIDDIEKALRNFVSSQIPYALITSHFFADVINFDIPTGSFRPLNLLNYPFYFGRPKLWISDSDLFRNTAGYQFASGLWSKSDVEAALRGLDGLKPLNYNNQKPVHRSK
jgi:hypothetical protein